MVEEKTKVRRFEKDITWIVVIKFETTESRYEVPADRYYAAKIKGVAMFLEEHRLEGRPYQYVTGTRKDLLEIEVKAGIDHRSGAKVSYL